MKLLQRFYLAEDEALSLGLTHHGSLFGIPAFLSIQTYSVYGLPKIPYLGLVTHFLDGLLVLVTCFLPKGLRIKTPIRIGAAIEVTKQ